MKNILPGKNFSKYGRKYVLVEYNPGEIIYTEILRNTDASQLYPRIVQER